MKSNKTDPYLQDRMAKYDLWLKEGQISHASKVIPVVESLDPEQWVLPTEQAMKILKEATSVAVQDCACRSHYRRCHHPLDVCLLLNEFGDRYVSNGEARHVSLAEAAEILKKANESGLVHLSLYRPDHQIYALCSCCSCCCHDLQLIKLFGREDIMVRSEYIALTDMDICTDCGGCVERCSFGARIFQAEALRFAPKACVGCGLCVTVCPGKATSMKLREPQGNENPVGQLIEQVQSSQEKLVALLESVADDQDWQPDSHKWSFRYIAAHLATVEKECYQDRINRIAARENPHFESYFNTDRDFSQHDLADSLQAWVETREESIDFLCALPPERWIFTGSHAAFGAMTLSDVLQKMLEHDQQHIQQLEQIMAVYKL